MSIGDTLAEARRQAGLTVTQVSQRTCIRETIIRGIERGDYSACGGDFYARGHIRSVARAVGADPEPLIREYDQTQGAPRAISAADVFEPATPIKIRERRRPNWSAAMALALAAIVGFVVYHFVSASPAAPTASHIGLAHRTRDEERAEAPPDARRASPAPTTLTNGVVIRLSATENCWVMLTTASGKQIYEGIVSAGTLEALDGEAGREPDARQPGGRGADGEREEPGAGRLHPAGHAQPRARPEDLELTGPTARSGRRTRHAR